MPTVREARPADVPAIRAVHAASIRGLAASDYDAEQIDSWSDVGENDYSLPAAGFHVVVAEADDAEAAATEAEVAEADAAEEGAAEEEVVEAEAAEAGAAEADGDVDDGTVVGFGALNLEDGEVRAVYVHPGRAGTGVGSDILGELEERAGEAGLTDLHLTASLNAVPFYERHGWVSTEPTTHELGDGVELEAQAMEKTLDTG